MRPLWYSLGQDIEKLQPRPEVGRVAFCGGSSAIEVVLGFAVGIQWGKGLYDAVVVCIRARRRRTWRGRSIDQGQPVFDTGFQMRWLYETFKSSNIERSCSVVSVRFKWKMNWTWFSLTSSQSKNANRSTRSVHFSSMIRCYRALKSRPTPNQKSRLVQRAANALPMNPAEPVMTIMRQR